MALCDSACTMGCDEEYAAMSEARKARIHDLLVKLHEGMKETTSLLMGVSASFTSVASTTSAPPRASSASISIAKEPTQAVVALSSLNIKHSRNDVNAPAICSTKCLSHALDTVVLAEVCGGVKEVILVPARAAAMLSTIEVVPSNTNLGMISTCSTKWWNGTINTSTPAAVDAVTEEPSLISLCATVTSLAINVVPGDNGKEAPTTYLMEALNLTLNGATPALVHIVTEKHVIDSAYAAAKSTTCSTLASYISTNTSTSGDQGIVRPAPWPYFSKYIVHSWEFKVYCPYK